MHHIFQFYCHFLNIEEKINSQLDQYFNFKNIGKLQKVCIVSTLMNKEEIRRIKQRKYEIIRNEFTNNKSKSRNQKIIQINKEIKQNHKHKINKKKKNKSNKKLKRYLVLLFQIHYYIQNYHNPKQIKCFYLRLSFKFERLVQFAKQEPKPDVPQSPMLLLLFKYQRKNKELIVSQKDKMKKKYEEIIKIKAKFENKK
ncbi:hypothetical protein TTHERM_000796743 (macronuclear) [Tetrahymena thermophila SB210]|uniref:Uncharacterized protein n=1 Tax=Tetrahymena thermophila (strain SB210) TaxID=312017 RepID=W7X7L4_TETTS|nr:hypothetical protein TTHERM_000796743 [Tetrahymena thermophila SB210]EWS73342.1 hypothetical protein TTHERM_000796743 [Tetrahymena thermophila SB210]|eukprot:XP_012654114.1 hypothetical protein TTHERM_000796743 [Tetrahymena thermophila SB210]